MEISFNSLMAKVLKSMEKVDIAGDDAYLKVDGVGNVFLSVNRPLFICINGNNVGLVNDQIHIGTLTKTNIIFTDDFKSGYKKVIEISDKPFTDVKREQTKTKKMKETQKVHSLSDFI